MGGKQDAAAPWARRLAGAVAACVVALLGSFGATVPAAAHNLPYALVDLRLGPTGRLDATIRCHLTPLVLGLPQGAPDDGAAERLLAMSDAEIAARSAAAAQRIADLLSLRADGALIDAEVRLPAPDAIRAEARAARLGPAPSAPIVVTAQAPAGTRTVDIALPPAFGPSVLSAHYPDGQTTTTPLADGLRSPPLRLAGPSGLRDGLEAALRFVRLGFRHILPGGLDHILFVIALAMGAPRFGPLVKLATTFTLAHSLTLSLAALGFVHAPPDLVEPAIALSIALAAVLSLRASGRPEAGRGRLAIVFGFGLLHGLGFASALQETGLPRGAELTALAAFNVGIEMAQVAVIAAVLLALRLAGPMARNPARITRPVTAAVALVGLAWTAERLAAAFAPATFG